MYTWMLELVFGPPDCPESRYNQPLLQSSHLMAVRPGFKFACMKNHTSNAIVHVIPQRPVADMPSHIAIISIKGEKGTSKARIGAGRSFKCSMSNSSVIFTHSHSHCTKRALRSVCERRKASNLVLSLSKRKRLASLFLFFFFFQ